MAKTSYGRRKMTRASRISRVEAVQFDEASSSSHLCLPEMSGEEAVQIALTGVPVILWGFPGVGKTSSVYDACRRLGLHLEVLIASTRQPEDLIGIPRVDPEGRFFGYIPPDWAFRLYEAATSGRGAILFLDEINNVDPPHMAAVLRILVDGLEAFSFKPPPSGRFGVVAAANPPEWSVQSVELPPPMANRLIHAWFRLDAKEFPAQFASYWGKDRSVSEDEEFLAEWALVRGIIAAFLAEHPNWIVAPPRNEEARSGPWPSPRTWDLASRSVAKLALSGTPRERAFPRVLPAAVGPEATQAFLAFLRDFRVVPLEEAATAPLPAVLASIPAWCAMLAGARNVRATLDRLYSALREAGRAEVALLFHTEWIKTIARARQGIRPELLPSSEITGWLKREQERLLRKQ
jgi:hypothetical protein